MNEKIEPLMYCSSNNSGVYQIRNLVNGNIYIGSAVNFRLRCKAHRGDLKKEIRHGLHFIKAYKKYGEGNFTFEILLECTKDKELLKAEEQQYLDEWEPEYNVLQFAYSTLGNTNGAETYSGVVSPEGVEYRNIFNLTNFCKEHNLNRDNIGNLIKGSIIKSTTGWTRLPEEKDRLSFIRKERHIDYTPELRIRLGKNQKGNENAAKDCPGLLSPDGIEYKDIHNVRKFCREHNLRPSEICNVLKGNQISSRGWKKLGETREGGSGSDRIKDYSGLVSPDGTIYNNIHNLAKFCRENNLVEKGIRDVLKGRTQNSGGWTKLVE